MLKYILLDCNAAVCKFKCYTSYNIFTLAAILSLVNGHTDESIIGKFVNHQHWSNTGGSLLSGE